MTDFEHLKLSLESDGRTALLELDHGKANEMGTPQLEDFERLTSALHGARAPTALITFSRRVSRRGTPIFIAGANVTERAGWSDDQVKAHVRWQRKTLADFRRAPVFHIAVVSGVALGWGTEYLLTADYRIAVPGAVFALPETGLGILPGAGGTSELHSQIGIAHALRLGMTGERIGPAEAQRIGLVQELAESLDAGLQRARELAAMAASRSPTAIAAFKGSVLDSSGRMAEQRAEIEARAYERCVDTGEAAIGRANFAAIREGKTPPWGNRSL